MLFFIKTKFGYKAIATQVNLLNQTQGTGDLDGLTYSTPTVEGLVSLDTDGDNIPDWEENLQGTDPTKKDTDGDGITDDKELDDSKKTDVVLNVNDVSSPDTSDENLTKTDKFSRELLSTVSALSQSGGADDATIEELGGSLADQVKNHPIEKRFLITELKIGKEDSASIKNYQDTLNNIYKKHPTGRTVFDVLQDFAPDENTVNVEALKDLDPISLQIKGIMTDLLKMSVPSSLATLHLEVINSLERLSENIDDIKLFDKDPIVALGGISQYDANTTLLTDALSNLGKALDKKLSN